MANKEAQSAYQRAWLQRRRAEYIAEHGGKCCKCGHDGSHYRLEFDHIDRGMKISHRIFSWARDRLEAELAKCQLLCTLCHHRKTESENMLPYEHGTVRMYKGSGCRCDRCRQANAAYERERRKTSGT